MTTGIEMIAGGIGQIAAALFLGEISSLKLDGISLRSELALALFNRHRSDCLRLLRLVSFG